MRDVRAHQMHLLNQDRGIIAEIESDESDAIVLDSSLERGSRSDDDFAPFTSRCCLYEILQNSRSGDSFSPSDERDFSHVC